jgi:hypothetical protein
VKGYKHLASTSGRIERGAKRPIETCYWEIRSLIEISRGKLDMLIHSPLRQLTKNQNGLQHEPIVKIPKGSVYKSWHPVRLVYFGRLLSRL